MAQKTYCVNPKCAKPIEYAYAKPNFCPHCGNSLTAILARPVSPAPAYNPYQPPAREEPSRSSRSFSPSPGSRLGAVQRKMEARRARSDEDDDGEDYEDEDDYEESSAHIDFDNFQFKAVVRVPQEPKMTLGDFVQKEAS